MSEFSHIFIIPQKAENAYFLARAPSGPRNQLIIDNRNIDVNLVKYIEKVFTLEKLPDYGDDFEREYLRLVDESRQKAMVRSII